MGQIFTFCDLNEGCTDLHPFILVNLREANNNTTETVQLLSSWRFVPLFNSTKVTSKFAMTLNDTSRSNDWYASKVLWRGHNLHIKTLSLNSLSIRQGDFSHWNTWER